MKKQPLIKDDYDKKQLWKRSSYFQIQSRVTMNAFQQIVYF